MELRSPPHPCCCPQSCCSHSYPTGVPLLFDKCFSLLSNESSQGMIRAQHRMIIWVQIRPVCHVGELVKKFSVIYSKIFTNFCPHQKSNWKIIEIFYSTPFSIYLFYFIKTPPLKLLLMRKTPATITTHHPILNELLFTKRYRMRKK